MKIKLSIITGVIAYLLTSPCALADISQDFSTITETRQIDVDGAGNESRTLSSANPLGYRWGGYNGGSTADVESVRIWSDATRATSSGAGTPVLWFRNASTHMSGAYAYTLFDSTGGNTPDTFIDLSGPSTSIELGITDIYDGWMGNGDNGSGLPGQAGEIRNTVLRMMIRDKNGNWFAGDYFAPNAAESNLGLNESSSFLSTTNELTYIRTLSSDSWYAISETTTLNSFINSDETALTVSGTAGSPDLTEVTGMGLYVWNLHNNDSGRLEISSITLVPEIPKTAVAKISQEFSAITEARQIDQDGAGNESRTDSSANPSGLRWGGYNGGSTSALESVRLWTDGTRATGSGAETPVLWFRNASTDMGGAYAYTLFDSTGGNLPDTSVNLSEPGTTLELGITDIYDDGYMGNGDNGSGLPDEAGEIRNTVLRLMICDKNGDWYAGETFAPNSAESNLGLHEDGSLFASTNEVTYIRSISADSWYAISENSNLNAFEDADETALNISTNAGTPDLTEVIGMGLYVHNLYASSNGRLEISSLALIPPVTAVATYDWWADFYNLAGADRDGDADLEPDGMDNLTEYALGGNPNDDDAATVLPASDVITDSGTNWLVYVHNQRTDAAERQLSYTVQSTDDLTDPTWTNGSPVIYVGKGPAETGFESVTNRMGTAAGDQYFLRLKIQQD